MIERSVPEAPDWIWMAPGGVGDAGSPMRLPVMATSTSAASVAPTRMAGPSTCWTVLPAMSAPRRPFPIAQIAIPLHVPQRAPEPVTPARPIVLLRIDPETTPLEGFASETEIAAV